MGRSGQQLVLPVSWSRYCIDEGSTAMRAKSLTMGQGSRCILNPLDVAWRQDVALPMGWSVANGVHVSGDISPLFA
jgi:hypothetical protein